MTRPAQDKDAVAAALIADLSPLGEITSKKMFGGVGIFHEAKMFAMVDKDGTPYLRANDETSTAFEEAGSPRHRPMPYWVIPPHVRDDDARLLDWARVASDVAHNAAK